MRQLCYMSKAAKFVSEQQLASLLDQARTNNVKTDVTGMLVHKDDQFVQVIEGEEAAIEKLYQAIQADGRHSSVRALLDRTIDERDFSEWSMAYEAINSATLSTLPGYSEFLSDSEDLSEFLSKPSMVKLFLLFVRDRAYNL